MVERIILFSFLKGVMLFVVILLIGTGWSLVKPYLNDREKKIVLVVLVLQVVDNVALVVFEETAPGSRAFAAVSLLGARRGAVLPRRASMQPHLLGARRVF